MYNRFNDLSKTNNTVYSESRLVYFNAAKKAPGNIYDFTSATKLLSEQYPEYIPVINQARRDVETTLDSRS